LRLFFLFGEHDDTIDKVGGPLFGEIQTFVVFTHSQNSFDDAGILIVVLRVDVVNGLLSHAIERFFKEAWHAELELHEVARKHHQVLHIGLELQQIGLHVLDLSAAARDALVYFLEELIIHFVHTLQHVLAPGLLANAQPALLRGDLQRHLEGAQVGKGGQVGDVQVSSNLCLKVHTDEGHEVFHSPYFHFAVGLIPTKDFIKYSHNIVYKTLAKVQN